MISSIMGLQRLRVRGDLACFTRPELKVERVSYPVMTPSAARGVLDAILWKPAIRWRVLRISVLSPIAFTSFRRNEVATVATSPSRTTVERGGEYGTLVVEDRRQQRNTVALRDVDYLIEARFEMTDRAGPRDNEGKFAACFRRRVEKGQHFHQPYLGCREFAAEVSPVDADGTPTPIDDSRDLGLMLWDIEFGPNGKNRPIFFAARLENGVMEVPADPEASILAAHGLGGDE